MRIARFHQPELPRGDAPLPLSADAARHIARVLRLRVGARIELFDGDGNACLAELTEVGPRAVAVRLLSALPDEPPASLRVHLLLGLSKGERMDFAIQKSVELGVTAITPVISERCVVRLDEKRGARRQRHWRRILIAACEQSGRNHLPVLAETTPLGTALASSQASLKLLLDPEAEQALGALADHPARDIAVLVGPEGGLSPAEIERARTRFGFHGVRLGQRILRTETAPLAFLAAAQTLWGDF